MTCWECGEDRFECNCSGPSSSSGGIDSACLSRTYHPDKPSGKYSEERSEWHNNVAPHCKYYYDSESQRRDYANKFGPNWASILSGCGDQ